MKIRNYWLLAALSFFGISSAWADNTPQACKPEVKQIRDNRVSLVWDNVEPVYGIFDGFEEHADFAINSPGTVGWSYWDMDHSKTYSIGDYIWQNQGSAMAFQIWNPSKTIPVYEYDRALPHSGKKCLVSWAITSGERRNDWLISPDLSAQDFTDTITLSFWARALNEDYGEELIKIAYSTSAMELDSFKFLNNGAAITVPAGTDEHPMWFYSFRIPQNARYVAINCVTWDGHALFIDDVVIATNKVIPTKAAHNYLRGYNIYCDGKKVNRELITEHAYTDTVSTYGDHVYEVESVFETGSPIKGTPATVNVPNIHLLPFIEPFNSYDFGLNFWTVSCPGTENPDLTYECYWKFDYLQYTMYNGSASFYPSPKLTDYKDYCFTSMEFDATELDGVMMCYDLALYGYKNETREMLLVEVFDGDKWITVDTQDNAKNNFGYTRFYLDLTPYVAHKKFNIRFNAQGENAYNIIEWYIGYVRLYEKAKADVSGTVLCGTTPVAGAQIRLSSTQEDIYTAVTAADGTYSIPGVDADSYTVTAELTGYNVYTQSSVSIEKGSKTIDIAMTRPEVSLGTTSQTHTLAAEATATGNIGLANTGNGGVRMGMWIDYQDKTVSAAPALEMIKTFNTSDILQASIGFDGEYFYMAQSDEYSNDALIYKYDKDNSLVGTFMPNIHLRRWFAMAYDGTNFYTVHLDSIIRIVNMKEGILIGEIHTPITDLCHIAYDEARDAFWVGALNTLALVDKSGKVLVSEKIFNPEEVLFSGSAYDPYFKEGPCLWIMDRSRNNHPLSDYTKAVIRRIDLKDMELRDDYSLPCDQWPGFQYGGSQGGIVWGEGLFGTTRYKDGHFVLMGVIMQKPGLVGIVDMYEIPDWLKVDETDFQIDADGNKQISYTVDAANLLENDSRKATVTFRMDPYAEALTFEVTANINAKAANAKPLSLRAVAQNDNAAKLTWTAPQAATAPVSYNIYRNGEKIGTATALEYTDNNLKFGDYTYAVSAVYAGNQESEKSNEAKISIQIGIACYAPFGLTAANVHNNSISLVWKDPSAAGTQSASLRWDNGITADGIMASGDWIGAASWSSQDLASYRNMGLKSVTFVPMSTSADFTLKIFENDVQVYSQPVEKTGMRAQTPFTVVLKQAYTLNDRKELKVGIECANFTPVNEDDNLVLGVDAGPAVNKKGNWLYMDGYGWFTVGSVGVTDANFNISLELTPRTDNEPLAKGYNIYRNGQKINNAQVTECSYTDAPLETPGLYTYTVTAIHDNGESWACPEASARIMNISSHDRPEDLAANISMNRYVSLHWNHPNIQVANAKTAGYKPFGFISQFSTLQSAESAVVTDGKYIYTSHRNRNGEFHKYDMQGNHIEDFDIDGAGMISDFTYDGEYFYGCGAGFTITCFDFEHKRIVKTMTVTETARHITYIPDLDNGKGGFEIGDWTSSYFVNKNGVFIGSGYAGLDGAFGAAYHDGKLYYSQQGSAGLCEVMEVDFATLKATGNSTDLSDSKILNLAANTRSGGLSLFVADNGTAVLVLALQQPSPDLNKIVFLEATQNAYISGYNVYRGNTKINTELVALRDFTDTVTTPGNYSYTVSAVYVDDVESDKSAPVAVKIVEPTHCEAPVHVQAQAIKRNVHLQWTSVLDMANRGDSMETYTHLATGKVGDWTTIDGDGMPVYVSDNFAFQGMDNAKTFFIVDENSIADRADGFAFSGKKSFVSLAAWDAEDVAKTNDWLFTAAKTASGASPTWISFMARGLDAGYKENFYVAYSTMGSDTSNFIHLNATPERVDYLWTRYTYQLPEGVKYVAIHYTSLDGRALFIDDVCMGSGLCPFTVGSEFSADEEFTEAVVGYYIYRNGQRLNNEPVKANSFFDGNLANGEYTYEIQTLYNTSCESGKSTPVKVQVQYENPCNAPEGLWADAVGSDVLLGWTEPFYDDPEALTYVKSLEVAGACGWTADATYYVANKWEAADLMGVYGYQIDAVAGLFYYAPDKLSIVIYQGGELMYEQDVTRECEDMNLSVFSLATPYQIDFTKDLTVGFRITATGGMLTMIYVAGDADNGYGNLYSEDGKIWYSAINYSNGQWKGNWFMITGLDMALPAATGDLQGYRMYRNGSLLSSELLSEKTYTDRNVPAGSHSYQVAAVYGACGEKLSEPVTVRMTDNEGDEELNLVTVGPNPAHESVMVWGEYKKLEIVDLQGKVRLTRPAGNGGVIDIRHLAAGVYFVRIATAQGNQVRKLVVW